MYETVAILAAVVFLYSMLADRLERTLIGGAISFTLVGIALGPQGSGLLHLSLNTEGLTSLAELTLALLLFVDAANADLKELVRSSALPRRMLLIGLPLTIGLGCLSGLLLIDSLPWISIALLATILAPTDAALGKAVVTDETVPNRIRTTLNFESGMNDGICVPIFLTFLAFALHTAGEKTFGETAAKLIIEEVGIGALVGLSVVGICALLARYFESHLTGAASWQQLQVPALALTCFALAQAIGGSGFIAAFVGGLLFNGLTPKPLKHQLIVAAEGFGDATALLTWVVFGATVVGSLISHISWQVLLYAVLSLTVVRMLPVWLSLRGTGVRTDEALFLGWFGPRGLASIVFVVMAMDAEVPGANLVGVTVACTILLSIVAHGISAKPLARLLAARLHTREAGGQ